MSQKELYSVPATEVLELTSEGVVCTSVQVTNVELIEEEWDG
jgi:hypothetical protein